MKSTENPPPALCSSVSTGSSLLDSFASHAEDQSATTLLRDRPIVDGNMLAEQESNVKRPPATSKASQKQVSAKKASQIKTPRQLAVERIGKVLGTDRTELRTS